MGARLEEPPCVTAAAVESVYRADLKRAGPAPGLLDGDDEGGGGKARGRAPASRSSPRDGLPESNRVRTEWADHQHAQEDQPPQDRHENRLRLALREWRSPRLIRLARRADEVSQMVRRYTSGVITSAPWSWYTVPMIKWDICPLR